MNIRTFSRALSAGALLLVAPAAYAQSVSGTVTKIDEPAGKISLQHEAIKSLDMDGGMNMVFRIQDKAMLKGLKAGDKVKFDADRINGFITVTKIQKTR